MTPEEIKKAKFRRQLFEKIRFEENVFLMFALKLLYRRKEIPLPVQNHIQTLQTEIKQACKGRRKRIRGKSIRYGKKLIAATLLKRPDDKYQAEAEHIFPLYGLINQYVRRHAENNYEYTAKRAEAAVKNALAIQSQYPTLSAPINTEIKSTDVAQEEPKKNLSIVDEIRDEIIEHRQLPPEESSGPDEESNQECDRWERPSEEELVDLLENKCDDNFDSDEDEISDNRQQSTSAPVITMIQPDLFDKNITHPLSSKKKNETQRIAHQDIKGQTLFDLQHTRS